MEPSTSYQELVERAVEILGYVNPVSYDPHYTFPNGYWLCTGCKSGFYGPGDPLHNPGCQELKRVMVDVFSKKEENKVKKSYEYKWIIYVIGPNECGKYSPYGEREIDKIKKIASSKIPSSTLYRD